MGNVHNRGQKSARKVLTEEEAENKKKRRGKIKEIINIHWMSKYFPFPLNIYLT